MHGNVQWTVIPDTIIPEDDPHDYTQYGPYDPLRYDTPKNPSCLSVLHAQSHPQLNKSVYD
jgi:hypothetical protein